MTDKILCDKSDLVNIADAVRSKLGVTNTYYVSELSSAIQNIQTGGITPTCTVTFSSNVPDNYPGHVHDKIFLTVFENNEIATKTISATNNTIVSNVVLNSMGTVIYTTIPERVSTTNATELFIKTSTTYVFTFTGNASIASIFTSGGGGGGGS